MEPTLETLFALMVVLLLFALGLVVFIIRALRRNRGGTKQAAQADDNQNGSDTMKESISDAPSLSVAEPEAAKAPDAIPDGVAHAPESISPVPTSSGSQPERRAVSAPDDGSTLLMQVWQDQEGYLVVNVEGKSYRRLFDVRDGAVGRKLLDTINRLVLFSKGQESRVARSSSAVAQPEPSPTVIPTSNEKGRVPTRQGFMDELVSQEETPAKKSRISMDPVPFRRRSSAQQLGITLNLAGEVEELLQLRLKAVPEYDQRYIHVTSAPDGALRFDVDNGKYSSIDEIPEPRIQELIRAAIADWESKR
jgi:hypothetical protein